MYLPKTSSLIVVRGVYIEDLVYEKPTTSSIFDRPLADTEPTFIPIPTQFTGVDSWPKSSNLSCWHCDQIPSGAPTFIPSNIDSSEKCDTYGHFCTWNCAVAYIHDHYKEEFKWDAINSVRIIAQKFTHSSLSIIVKAPPKTLMAKYCGDGGLSPQAWYELLESGSAAYNKQTFKFEHMNES